MRFKQSLTVRPCVTSRCTGVFDVGHTQRILRPLQVEQFAPQRAVAKVRLTELSRLLRVYLAAGMHKLADMRLRAHVSASDCACAVVQCLGIQLARRVPKVALMHVHKGRLDCLSLSVHAWQLTGLRANELDESGSRGSEPADYC